MPQGENIMTENSQPQETDKKPVSRISEDWLAVLIASLLVLLSAIGVLGENGISIHF
jgi:hypothetical protein